MPISFFCNQCSNVLAVEDSLAGRSFECPSCQSVQTVPPQNDDQEVLDSANIGLPLYEDSSLGLQPSATISKAEAAKPKSGSKKLFFGIVVSSILVGSILLATFGGIAAWMLISSSIETAFNPSQRRPTTSRQVARPVAPQPSPPSTSGIESIPLQPNTNTPPAPTPPPPTVSPSPPQAPSSIVQQVSQESTAAPPVAVESTSVPAEPNTDTSPSKRLEVLENLKAATVFINVKTSTGGQTGSGFLLESNESDGLVVTNAHVIVSEKATVNEISCIFHSGSENEFSVLAELLGKDEVNDLAVLKVVHDKLPSSIDPEEVSLPRITTPLLALGFPFGQMLSSNDRSPSISVSKCSASGTRGDDFNQPNLLQVDGGINSGNSGGPLVTEDGKLVGIIVSKIAGADNIGFAIPRKFLSEAMKGQAVNVRTRQVNLNSSGREYLIKSDLMDPRNNIESVSVITFDLSKQTIKSPKEDGYWEQAANETLTDTNLVAESQIASTTLKYSDLDARLQYQMRVKRKDGSVWYSRPAALEKPLGIESRIATINQGEKSNESIGKIAEKPLKVSIPVELADFAIHPRTGDIAAVDPSADVAILFRDGNFAMDEIPKVNVGSTPISIVYKRFGEEEFYILVCTQDSHMYVLDANEFKLHRKIPLASSGVSSVVVSENPKDPFAYYSYGASHNSFTAAVDLRKMIDRGTVFETSMDCALSADGMTAYRRGPHSPSGFESFQMVSNWSNDAPEFESYFYNHTGSGRYIPDPFNRYTSSFYSIYSKDLMKHVATLKFVPVAFMRTKPIVLGVAEGKLKAASYNTFNEIGKPQSLPFDLSILNADPIIRGVKSGADFKQVGYKFKILADEERSKIMVALVNQILIFPISSLQIEDEPFMDTEISTLDLKIGGLQKIKIKATDPRVKLEIENLPEGAKQIENGIEWEPKAEQVGVNKVLVNLKYGDVQKVVEAKFNVSYPFVSVPFDIANIHIEENGSQIVCWASEESNANPNVNPNVKKRIARDATELKPKVASIPLKRGGEIKTIAFAEPIKQAVSIGPRIAVLSANDASRVEVYDTSTMKRVKSLVASGQIESLKTEKDLLIVQHQQGLDMYNIEGLKRLKAIERKGDNSAQPGISQSKFKDGHIANGVLIDPANDKPLLIIAPGPIPVLNGADSRLYSGEFLRKETTAKLSSDQNFNPGIKTTLVGEPIVLPKIASSLFLENSMQDTLIPNGSRITQRRQLVSLLLKAGSGEMRDRVTIHDSTFLNPTNNTLPSMQLSDDLVFVAVGRRIYRWKPKLTKDSSPASNSAVGEFHIVPHQSQFIIKPGNAVLTHKPAGGEPPYDFNLLSAVDGTEIDDRTGDVTVDVAQIYQSSLVFLQRDTVTAKDLDSGIQKLRSAALEPAEFIKSKLGVDISGYPVAVPIRIKVVDNRGKIVEIQYFAIVDIEFDQAKELLQKSFN